MNPTCQECSGFFLGGGGGGEGGVMARGIMGDWRVPGTFGQKQS